MPAFVKVAEVDDLKPGGCKHVELDGKEIGLFNVAGDYYATTGFCPHHGGPLGEGYLEGDVVACPWHGWQFNVKTGESPMVPSLKIACFPVRVEGNEIQVAIEQ